MVKPILGAIFSSKRRAQVDRKKVLSIKTMREFPLCSLGICVSVLLGAILDVKANSLLIAKLCPAEHCSHQPEHPILDYTNERGCHCTRHPCWEDDGKVHDCKTDAMPFLTYSYSKSGKLTCRCSATPHYDSTYIAKTMCPGHFCDDKETAPVLDYDQKEGKCICRSHPCWNLDGKKHQCEDPDFPILHYRTERNPATGKVEPLCECLAKFSIEHRRSSGEL